MSKFLKLVQIGKRDLQLSDEQYRDLLEEVTGQRSARGLPDFKLGKVVDRMKSMGFVPITKAVPRRNPGIPRTAEAAKIKAIWITMHKQGFVRDGSDGALNAYVKRMTSKINGVGVERLEWLNGDQSVYVLEAIKRWHSRVMKDAIIAWMKENPSYEGLPIPYGYGKLVKCYESVCKGNIK